MINKNKLTVLKKTRDIIKKDWGACDGNDFALGCIACISGMVIRFIDGYIDDIKQDEIWTKKNKEKKKPSTIATAKSVADADILDVMGLGDSSKSTSKEKQIARKKQPSSKK